VRDLHIDDVIQFLLLPLQALPGNDQGGVALGFGVLLHHLLHLGAGLDDLTHQRATGQLVKDRGLEDALGEELQVFIRRVGDHFTDQSLVIGKGVVQTRGLLRTTLSVIIFQRADDGISQVDVEHGLGQPLALVAHPDHEVGAQRAVTHGLFEEVGQHVERVVGIHHGGDFLHSTTAGAGQVAQGVLHPGTFWEGLREGLVEAAQQAHRQRVGGLGQLTARLAQDFMHGEGISRQRGLHGLH